MPNENGTNGTNGTNATEQLKSKSPKNGEAEDGKNPTKVELTDIFGEFGRYQIILGIIVMISTILGNWNVIGYTFFTYPMDHWCARPAQYSNVSVEKWKSMIIPKEMHHSKEGYSRCKMYDLTNYSDPETLTAAYEKHVSSQSTDEWKPSHELISCENLEYDTSFFKSTILYQWSLTCNNSWLASLSQSIYMAGFLIAVLMFGQIGDRFGRRPVLLTCVLLQQVAGMACAFSPNFIFFIIMRFFIAMGTHGFYTTGFVVLMELVSARMRPKMSVILGFGWSVGFILLPGLGWFTRSWSTLQLVIAICSLSLSVCWWYFPESPRWLVSTGNYEGAKKVLENAAKCNKVYTSETSSMIDKFCQDLELEKKIANNSDKKASMLDLVRTPNMRKTTLNMFFAWFVTSFVYYGLSLNTHSLGGSPIVNIAIAGATEFPCLLIGYLAIKYVGRRVPLTFFLVLAGSGCLLTIPITDDLLWLRITLVMIGKAGVSIAFGIVYIYSAELFPTVVRNVGVGSSSTCARIGSVIAPYVKELGEATTQGVPLAIFGGVTVLSGLMVLLLPETRNKLIPDTLEEGEIASTKKGKKFPANHSDKSVVNPAFNTEEAKL